jgi:hypothetical protein
MWRIKRIVGTGEDRWRHALFRACLDENDCSLWTAETIPLLQEESSSLYIRIYTRTTQWKPLETSLWKYQLRAAKITLRLCDLFGGPSRKRAGFARQLNIKGRGIVYVRRTPRPGHGHKDVHLPSRYCDK